MNTYLSYQLLTRDIGKSLARVQAQPVAQRESDYYLENIGKVKSIDEFLGDERLFRYAMKAHGLEDMAYAKAFMKKVLVEGITDPDSFANKLTDKRYVAFATTYNFARYGELATTFNRALHDAPKNYLMQAELVAGQQGFGYVEDETTHFLASIGNVGSIDDLLADTRLLRYAMNAYGLNPDEEPIERVRLMLEGGVTDPSSPANMLGDKRYANFVTAFNFVEHGAQTTSREAVQTRTPQAFLAASELKLYNGGSNAFQAEIDYFNAKIGKVKTIGHLIGDKRLLTFALAAFGLDAKTESPLKVQQMLAGGVSDPNSPANLLEDKRYAALVAAFNFAEYGATTTTRDQATEAVAIRYRESGNPDTAYFRANITGVQSVGDLLADERLLSYAMKAYGLDSKTEPRDRIRDMLLGGVSDPNSPANRASDKRYAAFVAAFDFAEYGAATTQRAEVVDRTPRWHVENANPETAYFRLNIGKITSIDRLLSDSRLLTYAMSAYGLDASVEDPTRIRRMLEGGVTDPESPANKLADKSYARFVAAFDFVTHGAATTSRTEVLDATATAFTKLDQLGLMKPSADYLKAETAYYNANVVKLRSIDDLLADRRLLDFALSAYGLDPAREPLSRVREMLEGGVADPDSPANKLTDKGYAAFVSAFNFVEYGEEATTRSAALDTVVGQYLRQTLEEDAGETNEGVRLALYFERKASGIKSAYEILADPALSKVVYTALGLPASFANADVDKQAKLIESRLELADFRDAGLTSDFLKRFTSLWELENPSSPLAASITTLFATPVEYGVSTNLLLSIQSMKL